MIEGIDVAHPGVPPWHLIGSRKHHCDKYTNPAIRRLVVTMPSQTRQN
jgi:hypothetical protein